HFEKMLYDNAQLARAYLMGYQATGSVYFRQIVEEVIEYVLREMTDASGGFYSTEDADSEGEEGKFYVWTPSELRALLGEDEARRGHPGRRAPPGAAAATRRGAAPHVQARPCRAAQQLDTRLRRRSRRPGGAVRSELRRHQAHGGDVTPRHQPEALPRYQ